MSSTGRIDRRAVTVPRERAGDDGQFTRRSRSGHQRVGRRPAKMTAVTEYRLAALDIAGTTVDEDGIVYRVLDATAAAASGGPIPDDVLAAWKGTSKREALDGILAAVGAEHDTATVDRHFAEFRDRLITAYRTTPPTPLPGVADAIAELRATGVQVALQTGYDADIAGALLAGIGWTVGPGAEHTVDALVTSDQVAASRPAPYLIFRCMERTGVHDVRTVVSAGDTPNDVWAGHHAGCGLVVAVLTGSFDRAGLEGAPYTHVLDSVADLPQLLASTS